MLHITFLFSLQDIYKTILLSDLQYALDRKVELELYVLHLSFCCFQCYCNLHLDFTKCGAFEMVLKKISCEVFIECRFTKFLMFLLKTYMSESCSKRA